MHSKLSPLLAPLALAALALSGCLPVPHQYCLAPAVVGRVNIDGDPLTGATVRMYSSANKNAVLTTTSDVNGEFRLDAMERNSKVEVLFDQGDPHYTLQIDHDGVTYLGMFGDVPSFRQKQVLLWCDLKRPPAPAGKYGQMYCITE